MHIYAIEKILSLLGNGKGNMEQCNFEYRVMGAVDISSASTRQELVMQNINTRSVYVPDIDIKGKVLTCSLRIAANFNFCFNNCNLCFLFVTESRRSEIVIQAFHRFF